MVFGHDVEEAGADNTAIPPGQTSGCRTFSCQPGFRIFIKFVPEIGIGHAEIAVKTAALVKITVSRR